MSFFGQALNNSSERSEESRVHQVDVTEILRFALDDKTIGRFIMTQSYRFLYKEYLLRRPYSKSELAQTYYRPAQRIFTSRQVALIFEFLGEP